MSSYKLINKDNIVAVFDLVYDLEYIAVNVKWLGIKPYNCNTELLTMWLSSRAAARVRKNMSYHLRNCNLPKFISATKALSLNDTYWVDCTTSTLRWKDVSLYTNKFNSKIGDLSFNLDVNCTVSNLTTSPEYGTYGTYAKCWVREGNNVYMYKRGMDGLEPYSEHLASQVFTKLGAGISYDLVSYHDIPASKCKLFTSELVGYVPYSSLNKSLLAPDIVEFYTSIGCRDMLARMLVCDAVTFNTDRHAGNHGILVNNDTESIVSIAPGFDYNLALMPMEDIKRLKCERFIQDEYTPRIGVDFINTARSLLTSSIEADLRNLRGFKYECESNGERTEQLSILSNKQIDRILGVSQVAMSNLDKYMHINNVLDTNVEDEKTRLMGLLDAVSVAELEEKVVELLE